MSDLDEFYGKIGKRERETRRVKVKRTPCQICGSVVVEGKIPVPHRGGVKMIWLCSRCLKSKEGIKRVWQVMCGRPK